MLCPTAQIRKLRRHRALAAREYLGPRSRPFCHSKGHACALVKCLASPHSLLHCDGPRPSGLCICYVILLCAKAWEVAVVFPSSLQAVRIQSSILLSIIQQGRMELIPEWAWRATPTAPCFAQTTDHPPICPSAAQAAKSFSIRDS